MQCNVYFTSMQPKLIHGDFDPVSAGNFCGYEGYKSKSSEMSLLPTEGVICKDKPKRNHRKAVQEYACLHVWHTLLNEAKNGHDMRVEAPRPVALDDRYRVYMLFAPGVTAGQALSGGYVSGMSSEQKRDTRLSFAEHMGRLLRIKEREQLVHGDFQKRHVLFYPERDDMRLSVIDVEHSVVSKSGMQKEHTVMLERLRDSVRMSPRWLKAVNDHLDR